MTTQTLPPGSRTSLTTTALDSLASATYVSAGTIDLSAVDPIDVLLEVKVTPGTVSGNKQVIVYGQGSLDNTNFESGPVSGTTDTDAPNLTRLFSVPCGTNSTAQTRIRGIAQAFGGVLPPYLKIIIKNDTGAGLAASGHSVYYSTVVGNSA